MKVIYVTTSLEESDYNNFNKMWDVSLNPSNQNFHNKIIRSLAIYNHVDVISIRPFSKEKCHINELQQITREVDNVTYHYLKINRDKFGRIHLIKKQSKKIVSDIKDKETVIITDTINPKCLLLTNYLQRTFRIPAIGICTDSPSNITGTTRSYTMYLLKRAQRLNGFVTLTEGLNFLFNKQNKPHIVLEGVVESNRTDPKIKKVDGKYIFFGGALLPRYGVYNLIEAFKSIENKDVSLLICGHHADIEAINKAISEDSRIKFLGTLPVSEVLVLEKDAIANINPRPFTQDLDRLSIPSKTLEYLASGTLTISVRNTELEKGFKDCAIWAKTGEPKDLAQAMLTAINMSDDERKKIAEIAKNTAISKYSLEKVGELITDFSSTLLK